jgi:hypothetical protein
MTDGAVRVGGVPKRDRPEIPGQMMDTLDALAESKQTDWSVQMEFQDRWQERRTRIGWLRSAYLVAFAALGYRYILRGALRRVASQIAAPDTDIIPLPVVWKPKGNPLQRLCVSSMKVGGSSRHGLLLVGWQAWCGRGPGGGRVDQSSIRAGSPMVSCGRGGSIKLAAVAQQGHDTHRARPGQAAGYEVEGRDRHGSRRRRAGRSSTG